MASARTIEVKVGILILTAVVLLVGFVLVVAGVSFRPTFEITVGFDNPGALQSGAPVKIAGVNVGKVDRVRFDPRLEGRPAPPSPVRALVYAEVRIEERYRATIHDNAAFYVSTQGVLGEPFLAVDPGSPDRPNIEDGAVVRGLDPPRLDRMLAESYDLLQTTMGALRDNEPELRELFVGLNQTLKGTGTFFARNQDTLDRVANNVEELSRESLLTVKTARTKYVDNPRIDRILGHVERLSANSAEEVPGLLREGREAVNGTNALLRALGDEAQLAKVRAMIDDMAHVTQQTRATVDDARAITARIKRGRGSVGALVMDEQLFDDLQELARDLKHNPWKFFWKE
ncbi:MAG: MlaD family protein [Myxococcota bacterium]